MKIASLPALLTPFEGGFYGGIVNVYGENFAIALANKAEGELHDIWLPEYINVPGATSCFDSVANTHAMAAAGSPLAKRVLALSINGFTDWVIGARDVVEICYRNAKPSTQTNSCSFRDGDNASSVPVGYPYTDIMPLQTTVAAFQTGGAEAFGAEIYWTSTQFSSGHAYGQGFNYGLTLNYGKKFKACARALRLIPLED